MTTATITAQQILDLGGREWTGRNEYRLVIAGIEWTILRAEPRTEHILRGVVPYPAHIPIGMDRVMARWGYERVTRWEEDPEGRLTAELTRVR